MSIREMMSTSIVTVQMDDTVAHIRQLFDEYKFHHLLVVDGERRLVGVVSDRDLLKNLSPFIGKMAERPQDLATLDKRVHQLMTRHPVTVRRETTEQQAASIMWAHDVSCLPVVNDDGHPVGIITRADLLRLLARRAAPEVTTP